MLIQLKSKSRAKAQSTLEYAILVSVVIAAALVMRNYIKRGYQGHLRKQSDDLSTPFTGDTISNHVSATFIRTYDKSEPKWMSGWQSYKLTSGQSAWSHNIRAGSEEGVPVDTDYWPQGMNQSGLK
jgi:hypothetical protein